jgi:hypothetical protein
MAGPAVLPGVLSVRCPVCGAIPGRPCVNRRGYLVHLGSHPAREAEWMRMEREEGALATVAGTEAVRRV